MHVNITLRRSFGPECELACSFIPSILWIYQGQLTSLQIEQQIYCVRVVRFAHLRHVSCSRECPWNRHDASRISVDKVVFSCFLVCLVRAMAEVPIDRGWAWIVVLGTEIFHLPQINSGLFKSRRIFTISTAKFRMYKGKKMFVGSVFRGALHKLFSGRRIQEFGHILH